jgi:hypothetical protein
MAQVQVRVPLLCAGPATQALINGSLLVALLAHFLAAIDAGRQGFRTWPVRNPASTRVSDALATAVMKAPAPFDDAHQGSWAANQPELGTWVQARFVVSFQEPPRRLGLALTLLPTWRDLPGHLGTRRRHRAQSHFGPGGGDLSERPALGNPGAHPAIGFGGGFPRAPSYHGRCGKLACTSRRGPAVGPRRDA